MRPTAEPRPRVIVDDAGVVVFADEAASALLPGAEVGASLREVLDVPAGFDLADGGSFQTQAGDVSLEVVCTAIPGAYGRLSLLVLLRGHNAPPDSAELQRRLRHGEGALVLARYSAELVRTAIASLDSASPNIAEAKRALETAVALLERAPSKDSELGTAAAVEAEVAEIERAAEVRGIRVEARIGELPALSMDIGQLQAVLRLCAFYSLLSAPHGSVLKIAAWHAAGSLWLSTTLGGVAAAGNTLSTVFGVPLALAESAAQASGGTLSVEDRGEAGALIVGVLPFGGPRLAA